jgi:pilus assembly protein CpaB
MVVAVLIAVGGAAAVFLYVQNIETAAAAEQEQVQVLVASQAIPTGQTAAEAEAAGSLQLATVDAEAAAPGALSSIEPIRDQSALSTVFAGEQILEQKFGTPGSAAPLPIPDDKLAVSVQLSDPARVAGFVGPGSEVAVFMTATPPTTDGGATEELLTSTLLPRVQVIAAGQTTVVSRTTTSESGSETTEQIPLAILTLALDEQQAQKVVQAQGQGQLYFGLLTESSQTGTDSLTRFGDLLP